MEWLILAVIGIVAALILIFLSNRFFIKPNNQTALIRTGFGGHKIVTNNGILILPFLHHLEKVNLKRHSLNISLANNKSIITKDCMRIDIDITFYIHVNNQPKDILVASQIYGNLLNRTADLTTELFSQLAHAAYSAAAQINLMDMQNQRAQLIENITNQLEPSFIKNGLILDSVNLSHFDQTVMANLDANNAINAIGLKELSKIISTNQQVKSEIEATAEIAMRQTQLELTNKNLSIEFEQRQAQIAHTETIRKAESTSTAKIEQDAFENQRLLQESKIVEEHKIELIKIINDEDIRKQELAAILSIEQGKADNKIKLIAFKKSEIEAQITLQKIEIDRLLSDEDGQTKKDIAKENREKTIALLQAEQAQEVSAKQTESHTQEMIKKAEMQSKLDALNANSIKVKLLAEAEGKAAIIASENTQSDATIEQKITKYKLEIMPEMARQMMKPVEKIESIKINQISGLGIGSGSNDQNQGSAFDQALNSILGMSVSLPMMKKIGAEIGLDLDPQTATRLSDSASRSKSTQK